MESTLLRAENDGTPQQPASSRAGWRLTVESAAEALRQAATEIAPGVELSVTVYEENLLPRVQELVLGAGR